MLTDNVDFKQEAAMGKYNVCVYAICKNELKFAERWFKSMSEADRVVVLDTGSDDGTPEKLRELGAYVYEEKITPWRFDRARNISLSYVPEDTDICVCTDLDEVFEPGWRDKIEAAWGNGVNQLSYRYTWNFNNDGSEGVVFWIEKIHGRDGFRWVNPVHEVLEYTGEIPRKMVSVKGVQLDHHADNSKPRTQYLPLLEMAVEENPNNDRNVHYLGREYMFHGMWEQCINMLKRHLEMPEATWKDERCASMRFIGKSYYQLGNPEEAKRYFYLAMAEAPHLREPYIDLANMLYMREEWNGAIYFIEEALKIKVRPDTYICEAESWGSLPYDILSLAYFYTGQYSKAVKAAEKAVEISPNEDRLKNNLKLMKNLSET